MAAPGAPPAWYRRLPPALQRVAAQSDRVPALPVRPGRALAAAVERLPAALRGEREAAVETVAQEIADGVCRALGVVPLRVCVEGQRPHDRRGELHGIYHPANGTGRDRITLWMRTAKRGQVVAYRTFLRTLLHEVCHHLDYTYLRLSASLHTVGFYRRESSLFEALGGAAADPAVRGRR